MPFHFHRKRRAGLGLDFSSHLPWQGALVCSAQPVQPTAHTAALMPFLFLHCPTSKSLGCLHLKVSTWEREVLAKVCPWLILLSLFNILGLVLFSNHRRAVKKATSLISLFRGSCAFGVSGGAPLTQEYNAASPF